MRDYKRNLRVLHLASFSGNIGDLANHAGARRMLAEALDFTFEFTNLEIREFYWKLRSFDDDFIEYANKFDLMIVGGGNYFELWVDNSATGTSIDIMPHLLVKLKVPSLFFALGVDTAQGYSSKSIKRFNSFMMTLLERRDLYVCVRNDGSKRALQEILGGSIAARVPVMPDCGFLADPAGCRNVDIDSGRVAINIAGDMLERRFDRNLNIEGFLSELSEVCRVLLDAKSELSIDFVPHIWRDSVLIAQLLPMVPDHYLRRRVAVGSLEPVEKGLSSFLNRYRSCDLVLGMRFHANVCPIGMGVPSRGLLNYPQIEHLYNEILMSDRIVDVRSIGFGKNLVDAVLSDLSELPMQRQRCADTLNILLSQGRDTLAGVNNWLHQNLNIN